MYALSQVWKYVASYPILLYVCKYEGRCQAAFILVIHRKFVKYRYASAKRNIDLQQMKLN